MNIKRAFFLCQVIVCLSLPFKLHAQSSHVTASSGGQFKGDSRQIYFTVGESVIQTCCNQNTILTQGFHQPQLWITEVDEIQKLAFQIKAFPNPTTNQVNIQVNKELPSGSAYQVFDIHGALVQKEQIKNLETKVPFQHLSSASYILKIVHKKRTFKTFKIIKK